MTIVICTEAVPIPLYILDGCQITWHREYNGASMSTVVVLYDLGENTKKKLYVFITDTYFPQIFLLPSWLNLLR